MVLRYCSIQPEQAFQGTLHMPLHGIHAHSSSERRTRRK